MLGWVDFSRAHRDRVLRIMDFFREEGVTDELGLGTIRDAISDALFPGTSTIQTRAKYFLLIPWLFQEVEREAKIDKFSATLEELEVKLTRALKNNTANPRGKGIIGATLPDCNPKRKPSSIYWSGLRTYRILQFQGSILDYVKVLKFQIRENSKRHKNRVAADGDMPGDDHDANHLYERHLWCSLPKPGEGWLDTSEIDLTEVEAIFLKERIISSSPKFIADICLCSNTRPSTSLLLNQRVLNWQYFAC
jgi:hypothetical protein